MGLLFPERLASPAARTGLFYSTMFLTAAVANPYLAIWLSEHGLSAEQIGIVNALPILIMVLLNLMVGRMADRARDWRSVIVWGAICAAIPPFLLFFTDDYLSILLVWTLMILPFQAIAPVIDAAAMRLTRRLGVDFGKVRVWGTLGFVAFTIMAGMLLDWWGSQVFVPLLVAAGLLRAATALGLPYFRGEALNEDRSSGPSLELERHPLVATRFRELWRPWFLLPLLGTALLHSSHMMQMGFGALLWREQGVPSSIIGPLWAVAPVGEVVAMLAFARLSRRFSARHLLLASCAMGVVRWVGFAFEPDIWVLALLQFLHIGSFALAYLGIVDFVANWTKDEIAAEAQSFFVVIRQIGNVVALTGFGVLTTRFGADAFYVAAALALLGAIFIFWSLMLMSPRREAHGSVIVEH